MRAGQLSGMGGLPWQSFKAARCSEVRRPCLCVAISYFGSAELSFFKQYFCVYIQIALILELLRDLEI
jgi:hypothetical protein